MRQDFKKLFEFLLGIPLTIVSFYFIFNFIYRNREEILPVFSDFNIAPYLLGLFFLTIFFFLRALVWKNILKHQGFEVETAKSVYLLSSSEIKRYIPGSILAFISRVKNFNFLKIPTKKMVKMIFYESLIFVFSSFLISIPGLVFIIKGFNISQFFADYLFISLMLFLLSISLISAVFLIKFNRIKSFAKKIYPLKEAFVLMALSWIFFGVGNYLIAASFVYLDPIRIVALSSFFVLSWLIGYLSIVAPLGLGVREAVIIYGLSPIISLPLSATLSVLLRVSHIASEIIFLFVSYLNLRFLKIKTPVSFHFAILWAAIISYISYFSYVSIEKHNNFFTGRFDLGNMDQTVWNTLNGRFFQLTNPDGTQTISRLAIHSDFILMLISPFYILWNDPRVLLVIQSVILGLGGLFIYKISNYVLKNNYLSLVFGISYLLNPFVQKQNLFDFHPVTLATTFLLASFYFLIKRKNILFLLFLVVALLTKESVYIIGFLLGLFAFIRTKNKWWIVFALLSIFLFYFLMSYAIPAARGGAHFATEYFEMFGSSPFDIGKNMLMNPIKTTSLLLTFPNLNYAYKLLLPVGFLSLLAPSFLIFALPDTLINLLSKNENLKSVNFHYAALILPFIYISAVFGVKNLLSITSRFTGSKVLASFILIVSLFSTFQYGVLPGAKKPSLETYNKFLPQRREIESFLHKIPPELKVAATNNLGAHLSHREYIFTIPNGVNEADVIVFLLNDPYAQPSLSYQIDLSKRIQEDENYTKVYQIGDFVAFSKKNAAFPFQK